MRDVTADLGLVPPGDHLGPSTSPSCVLTELDTLAMNTLRFLLPSAARTDLQSVKDLRKFVVEHSLA